MKKDERKKKGMRENELERTEEGYTNDKERMRNEKEKKNQQVRKRNIQTRKNECI